jgi:hypothetical protein
MGEQMPDIDPFMIIDPDETYSYNEPMPGNPNKWGTLVRGSDNAHIPCDPANMDFQRYLEWCRQGGEMPSGAPGPEDFP